MKGRPLDSVSVSASVECMGPGGTGFYHINKDQKFILRNKWQMLQRIALSSCSMGDIFFITIFDNTTDKAFMNLNLFTYQKRVRCKTELLNDQ